MSIPATPMQAFDTASDQWSEHKRTCPRCPEFACTSGQRLRAEVLRLARLASAWADD